LQQKNQPTEVDALFRQATVLLQTGQVAEAERLFRSLLRIRPNHLGALNLLGILLVQIGKFAEAEGLIRAAVEINAQSDATHYNHGIVLRRLKRLPEALSAFDRALAINPTVADSWNNRGTVLSDLERFEEALTAFDMALALKPEHADAYYNRGNALRKLGRYEEAIFSYDQAVLLDPNRAAAFSNRGNALSKLGRYEEAVLSYDKAVALEPNRAAAFSNRGDTLFDLKRFREAISSYDRAISIEPTIKIARGMRLIARMELCDWVEFDDERSQIISAVNAGQLATVPFGLLLISSSAEEQLNSAQLSVEDQVARGPPLWIGERYTHDRIRVGYLSSDLRKHAVGSLTVGLFEHHDKSRFEVIAFSNCPDEESEVRARIKRAFSQFYDVHHRSDQEIAKLMRELEIDIAVDLNGLTQGARTGVLALRPVPVQVSYLGYPGTMGADFVDYIIADRTVIPQDQQRFYAENVVYLPYCYQANDDKRPISEVVFSRAQVGLPDHGFIFCSFNNTFKINPAVFDIWMRLLREVDGSVLWLFQANPIAPDNLRREAERRGVAATRLVFAPRMRAEDHLARQILADLFLDTLPYNAHTTASDALWVGLPVLTCLGATFAGRVAASLLHAVGLPELVTHSLEEYEALALQLARDPVRLQDLRTKLVHSRLTSPLFDTARFARHIEVAYMTMWKIWQRGQRPRAFAVEATVPRLSAGDESAGSARPDFEIR
jgi:protein O-GlcNAc transferase